MNTLKTNEKSLKIHPSKNANEEKEGEKNRIDKPFIPLIHTFTSFRIFHNIVQKIHFHKTLDDNEITLSTRILLQPSTVCIPKYHFRFHEAIHTSSNFSIFIPSSSSLLPSLSSFPFASTTTRINDRLGRIEKGWKPTSKKKREARRKRNVCRDRLTATSRN